MNLNKIRNILELEMISDNQKESLIIDEIAKDKNVIPTILNILQSERKRKDELTSTINLLLSKAHTGLKHPKLNENGFMQKEILDFYKKREIGHCFMDINKLK